MESVYVYQANPISHTHPWGLGKVPREYAADYEPMRFTTMAEAQHLANLLNDRHRAQRIAEAEAALKRRGWRAQTLAEHERFREQMQ